MRKQPLATFLAVLAAVSAWALSPLAADTVIPKSCALPGVPYVRQQTNFCGPASLAMVLKYWSIDTTQEEIGKAVYDHGTHSTNGAAMIIFARNRGLASYSWTGSLTDLKAKLTAGIPVIVLQSMSATDKAGHYRVATGFDDRTGVVKVSDPYDPSNKEMPYDQFSKLWGQKGNWCMLACTTERDIYAEELDKRNTLVHLNLAYTYLDKGDIKSAQTESRAVLAIEPGNFFARELLSKATKAERRNEPERIVTR